VESLNNFATALLSDFTPRTPIPSLQNSVERRYVELIADSGDDISDGWIITAEMVKEQMQMQHTRSAAGPDNIPLILLKHLGPHAYECIAALYSCCFQWGVLPQQWKDSNVSPIYKNKADMSRSSPSIEQSP
jgi:hypothetical protein